MNAEYNYRKYKKKYFESLDFVEVLDYLYSTVNCPMVL